MLSISLLTTLEEAYELALIRNECRLMMTNDQIEITASKQKEWFENFYILQDPIKYRVWLLKEQNLQKAICIGYFAANEKVDGFYITEGILEAKRGKGLGSFLLQKLIRSENFHSKPLYADIFNNNQASIRLHEKFGFKKQIAINDQITRFSL